VKLTDLISSELEYFRPMLERDKQSSFEQREIWREETIRQRQKRISLELFKMLNGTVKYGPFKGLRLTHNPWWGQLDLGSQCLGLYEKEILKFIENIEDGQFTNFIDIGAADGYYAVGLLSTGKIQRSICFEKTDKGREAIFTNWKNNGAIGQLVVKAKANFESIATLTEHDLERSLILIDIEGGEFELLNNDTIHKFRYSKILLEIHNWVTDFEEKYKNLLISLDEFFCIKIIKRVDRQVDNYMELRDFTDDNRLLLISERRPCLMRFLELTPKSRL
tara:strand:+ start:9241 stop:10074 length:834 start_codon:yes stop_codon:yes gene_type:complete